MSHLLRKIVVIGTLAALMVTPLGVAQADTYSGGENGTSLEWTLPTAGTPGITVTVNGEQHTIGGDDAIGGTLRLVFNASDWSVTDGNADCVAPQVGKTVTLSGKTPSATLEASFTPLSGEPVVFDPAPIDNRYPSFIAGFCA